MILIASAYYCFVQLHHAYRDTPREGTRGATSSVMIHHVAREAQQTLFPGPSHHDFPVEVKRSAQWVGSTKKRGHCAAPAYQGPSIFAATCPTWEKRWAPWVGGGAFSPRPDHRVLRRVWEGARQPSKEDRAGASNTRY